MQLSVGVWYELWWVWLELYRDGSCTLQWCVGSMCMHWVCIVACLIKSILMKVHPYMTGFFTFWQSAFSVTCFGAFLREVVMNV